MEETINALIERCKEAMIAARYTPRRVKTLEYFWDKGIIQYMKEKKLICYTPDIGEEFLSDFIGGREIAQREYDYMKSIRLLNDLLTLGYVRRRTNQHVDRMLNGPIGSVMEMHLRLLVENHRSKLTIRDYRRNYALFLDFLTGMGVDNISEVGEDEIMSFLTLHKGEEKLNANLKTLFAFMKRASYVESDYTGLFKTVRVRRHREKIPSFYSVEEIRQIEESVMRSSAKEKRDYAILLLATRLGLRISDIATLRFENIDWDENKVRITLFKTGKTIELPLIAEVGNALLDYILHGRPKSTSKYIFLMALSPYNEVTKSTVQHAISGIIALSGVNIGERHHGPHSMRHSLASNMLKEGISIPVISEVLGHKDSQTTMSYLKIDIGQLRNCTLNVPIVDDLFYNQKGGAFYA